MHTLAVGDEVYGMPWFPRAASAYAEYVTAPSRHFAKHLGAYVVGTASVGKYEWLRGLGADEVIDYHRTDVAEATGDIDVVVDLIGSQTTERQSVAVTRPGGLVVAVPSGTSPELLELAAKAGVRAPAGPAGSWSSRSGETPPLIVGWSM
ncbi:zinc-binding dehydrogenase [Kribbella sp. C-35]|uniref:zinc-binding dehydrogenase n=1 Tax=Kribbella sp. C-35 TaxID=2789276 RepID=UPI00397E893E